MKVTNISKPISGYVIVTLHDEQLSGGCCFGDGYITGPVREQDAVKIEIGIDIPVTSIPFAARSHFCYFPTDVDLIAWMRDKWPRLM